MVSSEEISKTPESNFQGIWNRSTQNSKVDSQVEQLSQQRPELGSKKKNKQWGIRSIVFNFILLLVTQLIVGLGLAWLFVEQNGGDPTKITTTLTSNPWVLLISSLSMYVVWVGGMLYVTYTKGQKSMAKDFGVKMKWYDPFIGIGIAAGLFGLVLAATWLLSDVLGLDMRGSDNGATISSFTGIWFFIIAIGIASILGPLCEELFFRGFVLRGIMKSITNHFVKINSEEEAGLGLRFAMWLDKSKGVIAVIVSSILFGLMHFQGTETFGQWFVIIATGTLGLVFGIVALKMNRLGPVIFGHMFYNGTTLILSTLS